MAQQTRHVSALLKRDIKEIILFTIGCHKYMTDAEGSAQIKKQDLQASYGEIKEFLKTRFVTNKGIRGIKLPRRTLYRYLEELVNEGSVKRPEKGIYRLTEAGKEKLSVIKDLWNASRKISLADGLGPFFLLGKDENGRTAYVNILIRVTNPDAVLAIEQAIAKNKISEHEKVLANLLATVVMWDIKGVLSRSKTLMEGKEDAILQILNSLPLTEAD